MSAEEFSKQNQHKLMIVPHQNRLQSPDQIVIFNEFIDEDEQSELLDWAERQFVLGHLQPNPKGPHRYNSQYQPGGAAPELVWAIRERALAAFDVRDYQEDTVFLGCNTKGGFIHAHRDPTPAGMHHFRMNIMLSKPFDGGCPIIGDLPVPLEERDLWSFCAGWSHKTSAVIGEKIRFVLSMGFLLAAA